jgi:hypothetical protein
MDFTYAKRKIRDNILLLKNEKIIRE